MTTVRTRTKALLLLAAATLNASGGLAGEPAVLSPSESKEDLLRLEGSMDMGDVIALLKQQQRELAAQRKLLESQSRQIETLTRELDVLRKSPPAAERLAVSTTADNTGPETPAVAGRDNSHAPPGTNEEEQAIETGEQVATAQADDPTRALLEDFKGAWRLPGTDAALSIGGFVKTSVVYNYDALQVSDRFIVGSIPVGISEATGDEAQSSVTANQSRLNFDLRQPTEFGVMRAFIEGDFAGSDETFRLRHAFGQWNRLITGKTWTTFMDPDASPEEIDFEGLNGRINVRQAQFRYMPSLGEQYELQFALEDPNPEIQNGSGITRTPDVILAGRFFSYKRLHTKLSLIAREIRGQSNSGDAEKEFAWGTSLSGSAATPRFDARDKLLFQLNYGNGIGRYVNDLSSIGNFDGIFQNDTNELQLFHVTAGYISWQHWWGINELRSNFTLGSVEVDNPGYLDGDAYQRTLRISSNLLWSPIPRIDVGGEYLWGQRENEDGEEGNAAQLQFAVKYRF